MKEWIKRWCGIESPSKRDFEDLLAATIETLGKAQTAHISDLRVLIDKGLEREAQMAGMVQLAMEYQFYRPTVTRTAADNRERPAASFEHLQDVAVFDEKVDAEMVKAQEDELSALIAEQNEQGAHKVSA